MTLMPKYYDGEKGIGKASTSGCIRLVVEGCKFIYDNCPAGTILEIVEGSPRKTTSAPVPPRNGNLWDPTDKSVVVPTPTPDLTPTPIPTEEPVESNIP